MGVVNEMAAAGVLVFVGGLEEEVDQAFAADATSGTLKITDGPFAETTELLEGLTIVDVPEVGTRLTLSHRDERRGGLRSQVLRWVSTGHLRLRAQAITQAVG